MVQDMPGLKSIYSINQENDKLEQDLVNGLRPQSRLKLLNNLVLKNKYAARAYSLFPDDKDREVILGKLKPTVMNPDDTHVLENSILYEPNENQYFMDFLSGRSPHAQYEH